MPVARLGEEQFAEILHRELHPSAPIRSFEHLYGREAQLETIRRAMLSPGRHIFVYGDRGVGKTSLAQTAAFEHQAADKEPILVTCDQRSSFSSVMETIVRRAAPKGDKKKRATRKIEAAIGADPYKASISYESKPERESQPQVLISVDRAIELVQEAAQKYSSRTIIVVDELDLLTSTQDKETFAAFIKQLGDQLVNVRFIFCGIGRSLDQLLVAHSSCYRYLESIELDRLFWGPRVEIIERSSKALAITVDSHSQYRISAISDGFPHYIHLVCESLYWEVFSDQKAKGKTTPEIYSRAINKAVRAIEPQLRKAYDKATLRDNDEFQEILWAVADHSDLQRNVNAIYQSYERIMRERGRQDPLMWEKFIARLNQLKSASCGRILRNYNNRRAWYEFTESITRGYVRLRAEDNGCPLALEYDSPRDPIRVTAGGTVRMRPLPMDRPRFKAPGSNL